MNKKALGIGEVVLDRVHKMRSFPIDGEKVVSQEVETTLGGPVPAALILLARLGVECALATTIADDEAGAELISILKKEGIHLILQKSAVTPINTVLVNAQTGSRTIIKNPHTGNDLKAVSKEIVRAADIILCDRHEVTATYSALTNRRKTTTALMDPSVDCSNSTMQLLKEVDVPIIPLEALHVLFPCESLRNGANKLSMLLDKPIVITMGKHGSAVWENGNLTIHPSVPVKVIDTLGAGDIFRGGFAYGMLQGWNIHICTQFANSVAALQCTKLGNSTAIPTREEVISMQKNTVHLSSSISFL
jgi:sugar/nucleoside kinase (ribokinase family)